MPTTSYTPIPEMVHLELRHIIGNRYDVLRNGEPIGYVAEAGPDHAICWYAHPCRRHYDTAEQAVVAIEREYIRRQAEEAVA